VKEDDRIARIAAILGDPRIGDDAAVLAAATPEGGSLVWTIDEQVEEVHFRLALCSFEDIGYRATMAAASDIAAMGARPLGALAAMVVPPYVKDEDTDAIARGQREACDALGASVMGGNLSRGERLSIATTWLGATAKPVLRSGAHVGDGVFVCGDLGLASAGFSALDARLDAAPAAAVEAWRRPRARISDGLRMASSASAAIDVSDGLAKDALHVASASRVRVVLDEGALRAHLHGATIAVAAALEKDPLDLALGGGEDYALLCTSATALEGFTRIGHVAGGQGVVLHGNRGDRDIALGWDHFA
jgi:thiamine-monophosphate kinase